tara:strand:+ start:3842 stop:4915 length:1074 start_codon:yes stop_codon:yes gene_type:complete
MPIQQVEYEFPDPDKEEATQEVEIPEQEPEDLKIEVEDAVGRETVEFPSKQKEQHTIQAGEVEIEVEDDTPPADRGKTPSEPAEVTDEELQTYGKKVQKRLKSVSKRYHDERRAKETAEREREALEQYAKQLVKENQQLKSKTDESHNALIQSAKKQVEAELGMAKRQYREAYESGEPDAVLEAQTLLNAAQIRMERVSGLRPKEIEEQQTALQSQQNTVQSQQLAPTEQPQRDVKAESWRDENPWFGSDDEMTALALGLHNKLTKEGINPQSDEYYEHINARMREVFPAQFDDGIDNEPEGGSKSKSSNVVAPATRSTSPNKVRLKQSEIAIAKRLGVPLDKYALQVADLARKQNG